MSTTRAITFLITTCLLTACATLPQGPSMLVLPGSGKNFDQFRADDDDCRRFSAYQVGGATPAQAASASGVGSAIIGTAIGAAAGAALGGGEGAAIGAGTGLLLGSLVGSSEASESGSAVQERYDMAYSQCMYAKGHRVPIQGRFANEIERGQPGGNDRTGGIPPPPPPGAPPPR